MTKLLPQIEPASCLVADPAWSYGDKLPGPGRGAAKHYSTMSLSEIQRMPLPPLARDCWLFLWRLHTHQEEALAVAEAWGFGRRPCSELVWVKQTLDGSRVRIGMGRAFRMAHEVCLVFRRGRPSRASASVPSVILAPRLEHSRKPAAFYEAVDSFVGDVPKVELFARRQWPGWTCFGDEMPSQSAEVVG